MTRLWRPGVNRTTKPRTDGILNDIAGRVTNHAVQAIREEFGFGLTWDEARDIHRAVYHVCNTAVAEMRDQSENP